MEIDFEKNDYKNILCEIRPGSGLRGRARPSGGVRAGRRLRIDLIRHNMNSYIYIYILESQLPHKIVNLLCTMTNGNIKLKVLWGG